MTLAIVSLSTGLWYVFGALVFVLALMLFARWDYRRIVRRSVQQEIAEYEDAWAGIDKAREDHPLPSTDPEIVPLDGHKRIGLR